MSKERYNEVKKKFPELLENDTFMNYINNFPIKEGIIEQNIDDKRVIGFSGSYGFTFRYHVVFVFYKDGTYKVKYVENTNKGHSYKKFMPFTTINRIETYNKNGKVTYMHCERDNKHIKHELDKEGNITDLLGEETLEVSDIIHINEDMYFEALTIDGETRYFILDNLIRTGEISSEHYYEYRKKFNR